MSRRYPAVVVLHGCGGFSGYSAEVADRIGAWGYVALAVDSLGPRGIADRCAGGGLPDQVCDATRHCVISRSRILSIPNGSRFSAARWAGLRRSLRSIVARPRNTSGSGFAPRFAYYPRCSIPAAIMTAPTLILIGGADDLSPAEPCREMVAHAQPEGAPIALTVYPGAAHAFDVSQFQPGVRLFGHLCEFNEPAARDAERALRAFVAAHPGNGRNGAD